MEPEKAIKIIEDCIVSGHKIKETIRKEYYSYINKSERLLLPEEILQTWQDKALLWANEVIDKLADIFISEKELYNFSDPNRNYGGTNENVKYFGVVEDIRARIDLLNEYDKYIREKFNINVEVVFGDKITQKGNDGRIKINK